MDLSDRETTAGAAWSHVFIAALFTGFCAWYLADAWTASATIDNLVLIAPASSIGIALGLGILARAICLAIRLSRAGTRRDRQPGVTRGAMNPADPAQAAADEGSPLVTLGLMAALGAYVGIMAVVGLAISTAAFLFAALWLLQVRRPLPLMTVPLVGTTLMTLMATALVRLPQPFVSVLGLP